MGFGATREKMKIIKARGSSGEFSMPGSSLNLDFGIRVQEFKYRLTTIVTVVIIVSCTYK